MGASHKPFDIVIFGATGYTGQLVAEYFLREAETAVGCDGALKWAIAARSARKLEQVKQTLKAKLETQGLDAGAVDKVPVIVADGNDRAAVLELVQSTRVVLSMAGPYALYSALLVELCASQGVHYCDLTGEMTWAKQNVDKFEAVAQQTGARIVHCCGFEAVPSDVMTFLLADLVRKQCHTTVSRVNHYWTESLGAASGGTCISLLNMLDNAPPTELKNMPNPFYFTSPSYASEKQALVAANSSTLWLPYDRYLKSRSALFIGAKINQHVVLRSNYLFKDKYGPKFAFIERLGLGNATNWLMSFATLIVGALAMFSWTRKLLWKLAPSSGEGPSEEMLHKGYFKAKAFAYAEDGSLAATGESTCVGDPGYLVTSKMISEVAFCLAKGEREGALNEGGILTPATACGHSLAKRLNDKKVISFTVSKA